MARVTISLPNALLVRLDELAEEGGLSRSELLREASAHYVTHRKEEAEVLARREAIEDGVQWLEAISAEPMVDDRPSIEILRELRETDGAFVRLGPTGPAKDSSAL